MIVALGITVENELMFLERHLDYLIKHFDEVYVADNGSTDGSVEFLKERKVHLIQGDYGHGKEWMEADHKNAPIKVAEADGCDWYVSLDIDELMSEDGIKELKRFMSDENEYLVVPRIEFYGDIKHFKPSDYPDYQGRCIKLGLGYHWRNPIHSVFYKGTDEISAHQSGYHTTVPTANIYHYGYALALERRIQRYYPGSPIPDYTKDPKVNKFYGKQPL